MRPMEFADDLSIFYGDTGVDAVLAGHPSPVRGLFIAAWADALGLVSGTRPVFRTAAGGPILRNAQLTINGVTYRTKAPEVIGLDEIVWPLEKI